MKTESLLIFAATFMLAAEELDSSVAKVIWQWEGLNGARLAGTVSGKTELSPDSGESGLSRIDLYAQIPIIKKESDYFGTGVVYRATVPQLSGIVPDSLNLDKSFGQTGQLILADWHKFNPKLSLYSEYNGGVSGLWKTPSESNSHLLFSYLEIRKSANRYFRTGAAVAYQFKQVSVYPLLGMSVGFSDHFALDMLFPTHVAVRYKFNEKVELATKAAYSLGSVGMETVTELPVSYCWSNFCGSLLTDYRIHKNLIFRIEGGAQFLQKIELKDMDGNSLYKAEPKTAPYVSTSIRLQV